MKRIRGQIFTNNNIFEYGEIVIEKDRILEVNHLPQNALNGQEQKLRIIPGLVDIHMHGANGFDACNCDYDGIKAIADYEKSQGITSICLATMTLDKDRLVSICRKISEACETTNEIKGIYLEGPFIAKAKAGAQNPEYVLEPDFDVFQELNEAAGGLIKVVTVAPEVCGAIDFIKKTGSEVTVSIAHTEATANETVKAFEAGAAQVTHLYNAMTGMSHREPGVVGAAADTDGIMAELICDGIHVDPVMIRNTFRLFGESRIILISDSIEATGMADGEYLLGDQKVIKRGGQATLLDGTIAGSVTNLYQCMTNAISFGIAPEVAIVAATKNPALSVGIYDYAGSIEKGKKADILVVDEEYKLLKVITKEEDITYS